MHFQEPAGVYLYSGVSGARRIIDCLSNTYLFPLKRVQPYQHQGAWLPSSLAEDWRGLVNSLQSQMQNSLSWNRLLVRPEELCRGTWMKPLPSSEAVEAGETQKHCSAHVPGHCDVQSHDSYSWCRKSTEVILSYLTTFLL